MSGPDPLRVTVMCTANRFRSPVVEAVLRDVWRDWPTQVDSCASGGPSGQPAVGDVTTLMAGHGYDIAPHRSRALQTGALADRDLVIVFEASHAAAAVTEGGAPRERTFLVRELLEVLPSARPGRPSAGADDVRALLDRIGRFRMADFFAPHLQYADPMAGPRKRFPQEVADLVDVAARVGARLAGLPEPPEPEPAAGRRGLLSRLRGRT